MDDTGEENSTGNAIMSFAKVIDDNDSALDAGLLSESHFVKHGDNNLMNLIDTANNSTKEASINDTRTDARVVPDVDLHISHDEEFLLKKRDKPELFESPTKDISANVQDPFELFFSDQNSVKTNVLPLQSNVEPLDFRFGHESSASQPGDLFSVDDLFTQQPVSAVTGSKFDIAESVKNDFAIIPSSSYPNFDLSNVFVPQHEEHVMDISIKKGDKEQNVNVFGSMQHVATSLVPDAVNEALDVVRRAKHSHLDVEENRIASEPKTHTTVILKKDDFDFLEEFLNMSNQKECSAEEISIKHEAVLTVKDNLNLLTELSDVSDDDAMPFSTYHTDDIDDILGSVEDNLNESENRDSSNESIEEFSRSLVSEVVQSGVNIFAQSDDALNEHGHKLEKKFTEKNIIISNNFSGNEGDSKSILDNLDDSDKQESGIHLDIIQKFHEGLVLDVVHSASEIVAQSDDEFKDDHSVDKKVSGNINVALVLIHSSDVEGGPNSDNANTNKVKKTLINDNIASFEELMESPIQEGGQPFSEMFAPVAHAVLKNDLEEDHKNSLTDVDNFTPLSSSSTADIPDIIGSNNASLSDHDFVKIGVRNSLDLHDEFGSWEMLNSSPNSPESISELANAHGNDGKELAHIDHEGYEHAHEPPRGHDNDFLQELGRDSLKEHNNESNDLPNEYDIDFQKEHDHDPYKKYGNELLKDLEYDLLKEHGNDLLNEHAHDPLREHEHDHLKDPGHDALNERGNSLRNEHGNDLLNEFNDGKIWPLVSNITTPSIEGNHGRINPNLNDVDDNTDVIAELSRSLVAEVVQSAFQTVEQSIVKNKHDLDKDTDFSIVENVPVDVIHTADARSVYRDVDDNLFESYKNNRDDGINSLEEISISVVKDVMQSASEIFAGPPDVRTIAKMEHDHNLEKDFNDDDDYVLSMKSNSSTSSEGDFSSVDGLYELDKSGTGNNPQSVEEFSRSLVRDIVESASKVVSESNDLYNTEQDKNAFKIDDVNVPFLSNKTPALEGVPWSVDVGSGEWDNIHTGVDMNIFDELAESVVREVVQSASDIVSKSTEHHHDLDKVVNDNEDVMLHVSHNTAFIEHHFKNKIFGLNESHNKRSLTDIDLVEELPLSPNKKYVQSALETTVKPGEQKIVMHGDYLTNEEGKSLVTDKFASIKEDLGSLDFRHTKLGTMEPINDLDLIEELSRSLVNTVVQSASEKVAQSVKTHETDHNLNADVGNNNLSELDQVGTEDDIESIKNFSGSFVKDVVQSAYDMVENTSDMHRGAVSEHGHDLEKYLIDNKEVVPLAFSTVVENEDSSVDISLNAISKRKLDDDVDVIDKVSGGLDGRIIQSMLGIDTQSADVHKKANMKYNHYLDTDSNDEEHRSKMLTNTAEVKGIDINQRKFELTDTGYNPDSLEEFSSSIVKKVVQSALDSTAEATDEQRNAVMEDSYDLKRDFNNDENILPLVSSNAVDIENDIKDVDAIFNELVQSETVPDLDFVKEFSKHGEKEVMPHTSKATEDPFKVNAKAVEKEYDALLNDLSDEAALEIMSANTLSLEALPQSVDESIDESQNKGTGEDTDSLDDFAESIVMEMVNSEFEAVTEPTNVPTEAEINYLHELNFFFNKDENIPFPGNKTVGIENDLRDLDVGLSDWGKQGTFRDMDFDEEFSGNAAKDMLHTTSELIEEPSVPHTEKVGLKHYDDVTNRSKNEDSPQLLSKEAADIKGDIPSVDVRLDTFDNNKYLIDKISKSLVREAVQSASEIAAQSTDVPTHASIEHEQDLERDLKEDKNIAPFVPIKDSVNEDEDDSFEINNKDLASEDEFSMSLARDEEHSPSNIATQTTKFNRSGRLEHGHHVDSELGFDELFSLVVNSAAGIEYVHTSLDEIFTKSEKTDTEGNIDSVSSNIVKEVLQSATEIYAQPASAQEDIGTKDDYAFNLDFNDDENITQFTLSNVVNIDKDFGTIDTNVDVSDKKLELVGSFKYGDEENVQDRPTSDAIIVNPISAHTQFIVEDYDDVEDDFNDEKILQLESINIHGLEGQNENVDESLDLSYKGEMGENTDSLKDLSESIVREIVKSDSEHVTKADSVRTDSKINYLHDLKQAFDYDENVRPLSVNKTVGIENDPLTKLDPILGDWDKRESFSDIDFDEFSAVEYKEEVRSTLEIFPESSNELTNAESKPIDDLTSIFSDVESLKLLSKDEYDVSSVDVRLDAFVKKKDLIEEISKSLVREAVQSASEVTAQSTDVPTHASIEQEHNLDRDLNEDENIAQFLLIKASINLDEKESLELGLNKFGKNSTVNDIDSDLQGEFSRGLPIDELQTPSDIVRQTSEFNKGEKIEHDHHGDSELSADEPFSLVLNSEAGSEDVPTNLNLNKSDKTGTKGNKDSVEELSGDMDKGIIQSASEIYVQPTSAQKETEAKDGSDPFNLDFNDEENIMQSTLNNVFNIDKNVGIIDVNVDKSDKKKLELVELVRYGDEENVQHTPDVNVKPTSAHAQSVVKDYDDLEDDFNDDKIRLLESINTHSLEGQAQNVDERLNLGEKGGTGEETDSLKYLSEGIVRKIANSDSENVTKAGSVPLNIEINDLHDLKHAFDKDENITPLSMNKKVGIENDFLTKLDPVLGDWDKKESFSDIDFDEAFSAVEYKDKVHSTKEIFSEPSNRFPNVESKPSDDLTSIFSDAETQQLVLKNAADVEGDFSSFDGRLDTFDSYKDLIEEISKSLVREAVQSASEIAAYSTEVPTHASIKHEHNLDRDLNEDENIAPFVPIKATVYEDLNESLELGLNEFGKNNTVNDLDSDLEDEFSEGLLRNELPSPSDIVAQASEFNKSGTEHSHHGDLVLDSNEHFSLVLNSAVGIEKVPKSLDDTFQKFDKTDTQSDIDLVEDLSEDPGKEIIKSATEIYAQPASAQEDIGTKDDGSFNLDFNDDKDSMQSLLNNLVNIDKDFGKVDVNVNESEKKKLELVELVKDGGEGGVQHTPDVNVEPTSAHAQSVVKDYDDLEDDFNDDKILLLESINTHSLEGQPQNVDERLNLGDKGGSGEETDSLKDLSESIVREIANSDSENITNAVSVPLNIEINDLHDLKHAFDKDENITPLSVNKTVGIEMDSLTKLDHILGDWDKKESFSDIDFDIAFSAVEYKDEVHSTIEIFAEPSNGFTNVESKSSDDLTSIFSDAETQQLESKNAADIEGDILSVNVRLDTFDSNKDSIEEISKSLVREAVQSALEIAAQSTEVPTHASLEHEHKLERDLKDDENIAPFVPIKASFYVNENESFGLDFGKNNTVHDIDSDLEDEFSKGLARDEVQFNSDIVIQATKVNKSNAAGSEDVPRILDFIRSDKTDIDGNVDSVKELSEQIGEERLQSASEIYAMSTSAQKETGTTDGDAFNLDFNDDESIQQSTLNNVVDIDNNFSIVDIAVDESEYIKSVKDGDQEDVKNTSEPIIKSTSAHTQSVMKDSDERENDFCDKIALQLVSDNTASPDGDVDMSLNDGGRRDTGENKDSLEILRDESASKVVSSTLEAEPQLIGETFDFDLKTGTEKDVEEMILSRELIKEVANSTSLVEREQASGNENDAEINDRINIIDSLNNAEIIPSPSRIDCLNNAEIIPSPSSNASDIEHDISNGNDSVSMHQFSKDIIEEQVQSAAEIAVQPLSAVTNASEKANYDLHSDLNTEEKVKFLVSKYSKVEIEDDVMGVGDSFGETRKEARGTMDLMDEFSGAPEGGIGETDMETVGHSLDVYSTGKINSDDDDNEADFNDDEIIIPFATYSATDMENVRRSVDESLNEWGKMGIVNDKESLEEFSKDLVREVVQTASDIVAQSPEYAADTIKAMEHAGDTVNIEENVKHSNVGRNELGEIEDGTTLLDESLKNMNLLSSASKNVSERDFQVKDPEPNNTPSSELNKSDEGSKSLKKAKVHFRIS